MMENTTAKQHAQKGLECTKTGDKAGAIDHYRQAIKLDICQPIWVYAQGYLIKKICQT